ncbi:hypothetical protein EHJ07_18165 [Cronobacter muytjensii]|nr:hypothetical protein [Cronobacter muytjensii]
MLSPEPTPGAMQTPRRNGTAGLSRQSQAKRLFLREYIVSEADNPPPTWPFRLNLKALNYDALC